MKKIGQNDACVNRSKFWTLWIKGGPIQASNNKIGSKAITNGEFIVMNHKLILSLDVAPDGIGNVMRYWFVILKNSRFQQHGPRLFRYKNVPTKIQN